MKEQQILVVDDSPVNRKIIGGSLKEKLPQVTIVEAENGLEAMSLLGKENISVIILDIMMPKKDGIQVLKEIALQPRLKNIPVIICSALNEIEHIEKALSLGALDYLTKPLTTEQFQITLPLKIKNALEYYEQKIQLIKFYDHFHEEMQLAEELQKSMISNHACYNEVEMWGHYFPSEGIGGDFFVCKPVDGKVWMMIADVSGHGIAAAMISTMLNVLFNATINRFATPGVVLGNMNRTIVELFKNSKYGLLSAFVACIDQDKLLFANAGHPYPLVYRHSALEFADLRTNGFLLGIDGKAQFETVERQFLAGDSLILYTDGLFDRGNSGEFANWGLVRRFCENNLQAFHSDPAMALEKMVTYFSKQHGNGFIDDAAVMMVRKNY